MNKKLIKKSHVLQHDSSDCGAACLLSIIRYYKGDSTLQYIREISGTSVQGTTLLGLYQAAKKMGFNAQGCQGDINSLIFHDKPLILHFNIENNQEHYVVCYGFYNEKFIISDPLSGIRYLTKKELERYWTSKMCLTLEQNKSFITNKRVKQKKKTWIKELIKPDLQILFISIGIGLIVVVLGMVMAVFSQKLIDDVLPEKNINKLILGIIFVFFLLLAKGIIGGVRNTLLITQNKEFSIRIIDFFYNKLMYLPKRFFDKKQIGDMVTRLNDTRRIQNLINLLVGNVIIDLLVILVSFIVLIYYSYQIAMIAMIALPIFYMVIYRKNKAIISHHRAVMSSYAATESNYINSIKGVETIKSFHKQSEFIKLNNFFYENYQDKIYSLGSIQIRLNVITECISALMLMSIVSYSSFCVLNKSLSIGEFMAILGITGYLFPAIANIALAFIPINEAKVAFDRMFEIISDLDIRIDSNNKLCDQKVERLVLEDINFRYNGHKILLKNLNMEFKIGEITAIVGESGCGKSTLLQIIQRFYNQESGNLRINDTIISNYSEEQLKNVFSIVPQEIFIVNGTVLDNIYFGSVPPKEKDILEFCSKYRFDKYFNKLPQGLMTIVGEEGINLSGGQRGLIAFARALIKSSNILLLDEYSASMDRVTENYICTILNKIKHDKIIVFITHRLNIVREISDKIYVMEDGYQINTGTHTELMKTNNFYSDYWN